MITDKEAREWFLQKIYDAENKFIARDLNGELHAYDEKPIKHKNIWFGTGKYRIKIAYPSRTLFDDVKWTDEQPLDIAKELGIVDWENVPTNTKVLVSCDRKIWHKRYLKEVRLGDDRPYVVYCGGATSWSARKNEMFAYNYCKLAEEEKQQEHSEFVPFKERLATADNVGRVCMFTDNYKNIQHSNNKSFCTNRELAEVINGGEYRYRDELGIDWKYAVLLTPEEIKEHYNVED